MNESHEFLYQATASILVEILVEPMPYSACKGNASPTQGQANSHIEQAEM